MAAPHREAAGSNAARRSAEKALRSTPSRSRSRPAGPSTTPTCSCRTARGRSRPWSSSSTRRRPASAWGKPSSRDFACQLAQRGFVDALARQRPGHVLPDARTTCKHAAAVVTTPTWPPTAATRWRTCRNVDSEADRHRRPFLRRQVGDVRVVPVRQVRLRRLVRSRASSSTRSAATSTTGSRGISASTRASEQRKPGIPSDENPRTGPYKTMMDEGRDLHELHALMAPRPFLVSGGSEDQPGALEGAEPRHRGQQAARPREPRRHDQPQGALARPRNRTSSCTCSSSRSSSRESKHKLHCRNPGEWHGLGSEY